MSGSHRRNHGVLRSDGAPWSSCPEKVAEGVGFEPTELSFNGFQDRRLRPLGHPSKSQTTKVLVHSSLDVKPELPSNKLRHCPNKKYVWNPPSSWKPYAAPQIRVKGRLCERRILRRSSPPVLKRKSSSAKVSKAPAPVPNRST